MERSWWFVLVLICNLSYGQVSSGAIANNRFLQRTNPQITRALNDGGSSLDHPEIQKLARQMVDLGIWGNLTMWMHDALVNRRQSGIDYFATKLYNIQTTNIVASQASTNLQPQLDTLGIKFDGSNDYMTVPHSNGINNFTQANNYTISVYINNTILKDEVVIEKWGAPAATTPIPYAIRLATNGNVIALAYNGSSSNSCSVSMPQNVWHMISCVFSWSTNTLKVYRNGVLISSCTLNLSGTVGNSYPVNIGNRYNLTGYYDGQLNDLRIYNIELTASQIDAIFQETRGKYGI